LSKKKGGGGGHDAGGMMRWLLTYADMITLLMALFVMLWAMSNTDKEKFEALSGALGRFFGGGNLVIATQGAGDGVSVPMPGDISLPAMKPEEIAERIGKALMADFQRDGRFTIWLGERGLTISLAGSSFFDSGRAEIRPEVYPILDSIAEKLKGIGNDVSLEGFADTDPIRTADFPSNWELSVARANRVRQYLEAKGVPAGRMIVVGYGDQRSMYDNSTAEGKSKNRRVDVVILTEKPDLDRGQEIDPGKQ